MWGREKWVFKEFYSLQYTAALYKYVAVVNIADIVQVNMVQKYSLCISSCPQRHFLINLQIILRKLTNFLDI